MNRLSLRVLSVLLALLTALSVMSVSVFAAELDFEDETAVAEVGQDLEPAPTGTDYAALERITRIEGAADGIQITWTKSDLVSKMAVYRFNGADWDKIGETADNFYRDKDVTSGNDYTYTLRALKANGDFAHDTFDTTGVTLRWLQTPSLQVENAAGGVKVSWDAIAGAYDYRVFYKNNAGNWTRLTDTGETSVLDETVSSGATYTYTVRCLNADGTAFSSYFYTAGKSVYYVAAPVLESANGTTGGIQLTWKASKGAAKYRAFRKNDTGWTTVGDTTSTTILDKNVTAGVTYTYTVRCINASNRYCSVFYEDGIQGRYVTAPVVTLSNAVGGVNIKWNAVPGAEKYRVYYYSNGWKRLTDTAATSCVDNDVRSGLTYTYTVRCINEDATAFTSGYNAGKKITYYEAPVVTAANAAEGVQLSWKAVSGVPKYRVFLKNANGWTKITDTTATTYLDKNVVSGTTYTYTVRCISAAGDAYLSDFRDGAAVKYVAAPDVNLTYNAKSVTVSWNKVTGAAKYRLYYKTANGWQKIIDTAGNSYEDKNVTSGTTYTYTVRCLNADNTYASYFRSGRSIKFVEQPQLTGIANTTRGVKIAWKASAGAEKYRVFYKIGNSWTRIGETTGTSFEHTGAVSGNTYTYTVRCVNNAMTQFQSSFDPTGKTIRYIASPKNIKAQIVKNTIKLSWSLSAGAEKYRVYSYGANGWTKVGETTQNNLVDAKVTSGKTYRYTVRCINSSGSQFTSDFDPTGVSCLFNTMPVLNALDFTQDGVKISWKSTPGAGKYRVFYYGSKGWTKLADTTSTSVVDTEVASGYTYTYTVRCMTANGSKYTSDYDATGVKGLYCTTPKLVSTITDTNRITFSWTTPRGATKYRVFKKINGTWTRLGETTSNSYTDKYVSVGNTYTYTVRVIASDNSVYCSGFDPTGYIITVVSGIKGFVYYDQTKYDYPYGDNLIADCGCGPTSFAMIASTLTGRSITPIDAVKWCGNSYYLMGAGTYWSYFGDAAEHFGITLRNEFGSTEINSVINELKNGRFVISSQGAGRFTKGGHFIVLAGVTSNGKIIVYDPNGANKYVGTAFSPSEITDAGTHYWSFSK